MSVQQAVMLVITVVFQVLVFVTLYPNISTGLHSCS